MSDRALLGDDARCQTHIEEGGVELDVILFSRSSLDRGVGFRHTSTRRKKRGGGVVSGAVRGQVETNRTTHLVKPSSLPMVSPFLKLLSHETQLSSPPGL